MIIVYHLGLYIETMNYYGWRGNIQHFVSVNNVDYKVEMRVGVAVALFSKG
jgi:hypothetical protein